MDYKEFFTFTQQERRGIAAFLIIVTIIILTAEYWPKNLATKGEDVSQFYFPSDSLTNEKDESDEENTPIWQDTYQTEKSFQKFDFDPNNISYDSLLLLGFSKYGAKSLTNFKAKGGKIKDEAKFKTIYGIDSNLVIQLRNFIKYAPLENSNKAETEKNKVETLEKIQAQVELNSTDSLTLEAIKGVGPYMVKRILHFRNRLGGYLYKEQLVELNVIADSLYQPVSQYFTVDTSLIKKINLNTADYKTFSINPYFSAETINSILKYRKQHGPFADIRHISRIRSLKEDTGKKILPYLTI